MRLGGAPGWMEGPLPGTGGWGWGTGGSDEPESASFPRTSIFSPLCSHLSPIHIVRTHLFSTHKLLFYVETSGRVVGLKLRFQTWAEGTDVSGHRPRVRNEDT